MKARFAIGDRVKAKAVPSGFPSPLPERRGLIVAKVTYQDVTPYGMSPYWRVKAEKTGDPYNYVEGAESFFEHDA